MKHLLIVLCFLFGATQQGVSQKAVNKFIDHLKKHDSAYAVTLPGWLLRKGARIALNGSDVDYRLEEGYKDIIRGIKRLRVVVIPENVDYSTSKLRKSIQQIKEADNLVDYAKVRDGDADVHVMVKEKGDDIIKNLVVIVHSDEEMVVMTLKTDISMDQLKNANLSFNEKKIQ